LIFASTSTCDLNSLNNCERDNLMDILREILMILLSPQETKEVALEEEPAFIETDFCTEEYNPVCGMDNVTYNNDCLAKKAGIEIQYNGSCAVEIDIMAYVQRGVDGVTEKTFLSFIDDITEFYQDNDLNVVFKVKNLEWYDSGEDCGRDLKGNDVIMCVGPDKGGYLGSPYFISGANTNAPFGFTEIGIMAESHELAHFLGFQDLYWFDCQGILNEPGNSLFEKDIMYYPYTSGNGFLTNSRYILAMNAENIKREGNSGIISPVERTPSSFSIYTGLPNTSCRVYQNTRDYSTFKSTINSAFTVKGVTDDSGVLTIDNNNMSVLGYGSNEIDILYIECGMNVFWLNSLVWEDCYIENGANSICSVKCTDSNWCEYEK
jgi:hypothetical protein